LPDLRQHGAPCDRRSIITTRYRRTAAAAARLVIAHLAAFHSDAGQVFISGPRSTRRLVPLINVQAARAVVVRQLKSISAFLLKGGQFV
jgi:hypothetical protein